MSCTDQQDMLNIKEEGSELENFHLDVHQNVHMKQEPVGVAEEVHIKEELDLYADHEIKEELVIGPVMLQPTDSAQAIRISLNDSLNVDTRPYKCDICTKCFIRKHHLKCHKITHRGDKPYQCDICNKCFWHKISYNTHLRNHTGEKPYICDQCNKLFNNKASYNSHLRFHRGEKPYKCDICTAGFRRKHELKNHVMIVHTGEKLLQV